MQPTRASLGSGNSGLNPRDATIGHGEPPTTRSFMVNKEWQVDEKNPRDRPLRTYIRINPAE